MACYRNGGCGPYEMRSCGECPASKRDYLKRYDASEKETQIMTMEEALAIVEKQLEDYKKTSDNFESVFPGAVSAYHPLVDAYTLAVSAMKDALNTEHADPNPWKDV